MNYVFQAIQPGCTGVKEFTGEYIIILKNREILKYPINRSV